MRSLEQLVTSQTDVISTLTDRLTRITIDMDRMSNWIQRHPHHQSPSVNPNRPQSEPPIDDLYGTAPPIGTQHPISAPPSARQPTPQPPVNPERTQRREYMERDRTVSPNIRAPYQELSPQPQIQQPRSHSLGVKLRTFNGKYTENVQAWISIIEDQFVANHTPDDTKVPSISALFKLEAETWYLWLKDNYGRTPTWNELKQELLVKFAPSSIRKNALRDKLRGVPYDGPKKMGSYVSQYRYIETQIPVNEMAFYDRFSYFIAPFSGTLQRHLK